MRLRALWLLAPLALGGCAAWVPLALSAAGGAVTFAKDVVGFDVSWRALMAPVMPPWLWPKNSVWPASKCSSRPFLDTDAGTRTFPSFRRRIR